MSIDEKMGMGIHSLRSSQSLSGWPDHLMAEIIALVITLHPYGKIGINIVKP